MLALVLVPLLLAAAVGVDDGVDATAGSSVDDDVEVMATAAGNCAHELIQSVPASRAQ